MGLPHLCADFQTLKASWNLQRALMGNGLIAEEAGAASEAMPKYKLKTAHPEFRWSRSGVT